MPDEMLLAKVETLSARVENLATAQGVTNALQDDQLKAGERSIQAIEQANALALRVDSGDRKRRRLTAGFSLMALILVGFGWLAVDQAATSHRASALSRHLLDSDLARAEASYAGCTARNKQITGINAQLASSATVLPALATYLADLTAALPSGPAGDKARADFAHVIALAADAPVQQPDKPTDCSVYLKQADALRAQGAK